MAKPFCVDGGTGVETYEGAAADEISIFAGVVNGLSADCTEGLLLVDAAFSAAARCSYAFLLARTLCCASMKYCYYSTLLFKKPANALSLW